MPLLRSRFLSATASLAAAALLGTTLAAVPASAAPSERLPAASQAEVDAGEPAAVDRFIVKFADDAGRTAAVRADAYEQPAEELGTEVREVRATATGARVVTTDRELDADEAADLVAELEADPAIDYAEPDLLLKPAATPNDTHYEKQWDLWEDGAGLRVPAAWDYSRGEGVVVAVVDTGITDHSDLNANVLPGHDMISDPYISRDGNGRDGNPQDEGDWYDAGYCGDPEDSSESSWHGTHVAGTIAAVADNQGVTGIAPNAKILPVRVLGSCGGYTSDITDGIIWAAGGAVSGVPANPTPADVINLSLGGTGTCSASIQSAADTAHGAGAVLVVAAGNESMNVRYSTPANCNHVIAVAASDRSGNQAWYSNYGALLDVTAPGGDLTEGPTGGIYSTVNAGPDAPGAESYGYYEGTSMATPHVSGVVALLLSARPSMTPAQVEAHLKSTARALPGTCDGGCGAGLVDAAAALRTLAAATPKISGTATVGKTLTAGAGTWNPTPEEFQFRWNRSGQPITGATGSSYTLTPTDAGQRISVTVTGTRTGYIQSHATSAATAVVAKGTLAGATPSIVGTRKVGSTLTAKAGTWTAGTTMAYQWYRSGTKITNATKPTYKLAGADAGKRITVKVTGTKSGYTTLSRTSAKTGTIAKGTLRTDTPTISGTRKVGSKLTAKTGTWTSGTTLSYRWYRSGEPIKGATKSTYRLVTADRNRTIKVRVTGTKTGYTTARTYSKATARIR